jgi:hypothetical protein
MKSLILIGSVGLTLCLVGCGGGSDATSQSAAPTNDGNAVSYRQVPTRRKVSKEAEAPAAEGIPEHGPNWSHEARLGPNISTQHFGAGSRASVEYRELFERLHPDVGHHPGPETIKGEESVSKVTATGSLHRGGNSPWTLTVKYRVEYQSGLVPVGVTFDVRANQQEQGRGGSRALDNPGGVSSGEVDIPLVTGERPLQIKITPYSKSTAFIGEGATILVR